MGYTVHGVEKESDTTERLTTTARRRCRRDRAQTSLPGLSVTRSPFIPSTSFRAFSSSLFRSVPKPGDRQCPRLLDPARKSPAVYFGSLARTQDFYTLVQLCPKHEHPAGRATGGCNPACAPLWISPEEGTPHLNSNTIILSPSRSPSWKHEPSHKSTKPVVTDHGPNTRSSSSHPESFH